MNGRLVCRFSIRILILLVKSEEGKLSNKGARQKGGTFGKMEVNQGEGSSLLLAKGEEDVFEA